MDVDATLAKLCREGKVKVFTYGDNQLLLPIQLSIPQVSELTGMPIWTIRGYLAKNILPCRRIRRRVYIPTDKLFKWLAKFDVEPVNSEGNDDK